MQSRLGAMVAVSMLASLGIGLSACERSSSDAARRSAQKEVQTSARSAGAPEGILGALWLMNMDEVRQVRPDVQPGVQAYELVEFVEMFGRVVAVAYVFDDGVLLMVYVTFPAPSSREEYDAARTEIVAAYGAMPEPKCGEDGRLAASKQVGRIKISHALYEQQGTLVQQLLIYRSR